MSRRNNVLKDLAIFLCIGLFVYIVVAGVVGPAQGNVFSNIMAAVDFTPSYSGQESEERPIPTPRPPTPVPAVNPPSPTSDVILLAYNPPANQAALADRMVIKEANLELQVEDTDQAVDRITRLTADYGGYLLHSETWYTDEDKYALLTLALPSVQFEQALQRLRNVGLVLKEVTSGQDVSAEYVDLESRLRNLEATAARIRSLLEKAEDVEEALEINIELAEIEGEIEQVQGQMNFYAGRAAFSTVTVQLSPERPAAAPTPEPTATPGWSVGRTFEQASGVTRDMGRFSVDMLIWAVVVGGPPLLLLGVLVGFAYWVRQRVR